MACGSMAGFLCRLLTQVNAGEALGMEIVEALWLTVRLLG